MKSIKFFFKAFLHTVIHSDAGRGSWENEIIAAFRMKKLGCLAAMKARISFSYWYRERYAKHEMKLTPEQRRIALRLGWAFDEFFDRYGEQVSPSCLDLTRSAFSQLADKFQSLAQHGNPIPMENASSHTAEERMKFLTFFFKTFWHTIIKSDARRGSWENEVIAAFRLKRLGCLAAMKAQISFSKWYREKYAKHAIKLTPEQRRIALRMGWAFDEFFDRYGEQVSPSRLKLDTSIFPQPEIVRVEKEKRRKNKNRHFNPAGMGGKALSRQK